MRNCKSNQIPHVRGSGGTAFLAVLLLTGLAGAGPSAGEDTLQGLAALRQGDYGVARARLDAATRAGVPGEESCSGLLRVLRETGEYGEAERMAALFLERTPAAAGVHFESGRIAMERGNLPRAEQALRRAVELSDRGPGEIQCAAMRELGLLLEQAGRIPEAREIWEALVESNRRGALRGSAMIGCAAVAAWRLGYYQAARDLFLDATSEFEHVDLEALTAFGYLFLEKYNAAEAISVFRDTLKINKSYPPALVGMALARQYDDGAQAEKNALAALTVNPSFVPALALMAELFMQEEDNGAALAQVKKALSVNPASLEALSLAAVCHLAARDQASFSDTERKVLGLNPGYGRFYSVLAEHQVMRRKYAEAVGFARKAAALDPRLWEAHAILGMNLMRLGDLKAGREALEVTFRGDPFNVWAYNTLELLDQMAKFSRTGSGNFVFLMDEADRPALAPALGRLAEEAYAGLTRKYGYQPEGPLQVEVFPDHGGFAVRTLGLPGLGALGVCFGKVIALDSPRARQAASFNWGSTLWHEMAHVVTLQMTRHNIPRWLSEGLSVYEERRARPGWGDDLTPSFVRAHQEGRLLKASELNAGMMRPKYPEQVSHAYYQASLVCELIDEKFGFEAIRKILQLYARDLPTPEVFRQAIGWDSDALDREFSAYLAARMKDPGRVLRFEPIPAAGRTDAETRKALEDRLERNPDDYFALLALGTLIRGADPQGAERRLLRAQALFPQYVGAGNPYQVLGEIYQGQGKQREELEQIEAWVRYDESALAPLLRAAAISREQGDWIGAASALDRARFIYPFDGSLYAQLGEAAESLRRWDAAAEAYEVLAEMSPLDPAGAHYRLARVLYELGNRERARRELLRSLEIAPTYEKALALLLKLREGNP